ncbi:histidine kinase [Oceanirhabdus sp. W0125-5]|uniref:histidine kinase n=1 Tax=Oceanirhabdus sp. W0125-5 TaxID=2999116 RepID=UPI0022F300ED|nr:histidine kinase [Oceanirhabdus sp. W0125-5]WBW98365.1 histidine kinase [Oceanirhabdus sp. W0125-5]
MDKQRLLYENLKNIKDYWVESSLEGLNPDTDLIWSEFEEQYKLLQSKIITDTEKAAYEKILNEVIQGVLHSVLVMIDGGDELADSYTLDLIDRETTESLKESIALHEEILIIY